jgi:hypothetical protein
MTILYVIGNGFDLHHGMPTAYRDFGVYLKHHHPDIYEEMELYFTVDDEFWWQFEAQLAHFDADTLAATFEHQIVSYAAEDWSDADHHNYAWELERVVNALSVELLAAFEGWIHTIEIPLANRLSVPRVRVAPQARFLTFNYTATLQQLYCVADEDVLHIHGAAHRDERLVLGHGRNVNPEARRARRLDPERTDTRVLEGEKILDRYFDQTFKPTESIIARYLAWFRGLADIDEVRVLGHSLSDVDVPYLEQVMRHVSPGAIWRISTRGDPAGLKKQVDKLAHGITASFHPLHEV